MRALLAGMVVLAVAGMASAAITVTAQPNISLLASDQAGWTAAQTFTINVTSTVDDVQQGMDLYVQIGDALSGTITNVALGSVGGAWATPAIQYGSTLGNPAAAYLAVVPSADNFAPSGQLATVTLNTTGMAAGTYSLLFSSTVQSGPTGGSNFLNADFEPVGTFVNSTITITPEPATLSVLALGGLALLRRKRQ